MFPRIALALATVALIAAALLPTPGLAADKGQAKRSITISFDAPATNYKVRIEGVYKVDKEIWAVSRVSSKGSGGQAITTISDTVNVVQLDLPVKHKVLGKTWKWGDNTDTIEFVPADGEKALTEKLAGAEKVPFTR